MSRLLEFIGEQNFCKLIEELPMEWRDPLVDVSDTFWFVNQALMFKLDVENPAVNHPELFLEAVRLTFARHAELKALPTP